MPNPPPTLVAYQAAFARFLLRAEAEPDAVLQAALNAEPDASTRTEIGLRVYRNNVLYSLTQALVAQFPVVHRLVGDAFFGALARDYVRAEPPLDPALTYYGHLFADFIRTSSPCRALPYLADVATLELACQRALHAADDPLLDLAALGAVAPQRLGDAHFKLQASASLLASTYPIDLIWAANLAADAADEIRLDTGQTHYLLIYRQQLQVQVVTLQAPAFTLLKQLQQGLALQQAFAVAEQQHALTLDELGPLLGYLLGVQVFSSYELQPEEGAQ